MSFQIKSRSNGATEQTRAFPVALDATKTFFVDQFGAPCFGLGEDAAELATSLNQSDIEVYLNDRVAKGINLLWIQSLENILSPNPPNNFYGDAPFTGGVDFVNPNNAFWLNMDYVMRRCHDQGMTVVFNPMFFGLSDSQGYRSSVTNSSDSVLKTFAAFLAVRYGSFTNLIWLIGGDADPNNSGGYAKLNTFATELKRLTPNRLMTMEACRVLEAGGDAPKPGYSAVDAHVLAFGSVQAWLDINWIYVRPATVLERCQTGYGQGLACLLGEGWYELENSITLAQLRSQAYLSLLGGCPLGHLFGNGAIWSFNRGGTESGNPWKGQLGSTGSLDFQRFGKLARSRSFQKLVPDIAGSVMTVGSSNGSICARTSDGKSIIAYLPSSQTVTIDMSKITDAGSQANCNWYNPQTGAVTSIGTFANSSTRNFTSPDSNDWVLVIDSAAAGLGAPGA